MVSVICSCHATRQTRNGVRKKKSTRDGLKHGVFGARQGDGRLSLKEIEGKGLGCMPNVENLNF